MSFCVFGYMQHSIKSFTAAFFYCIAFGTLCAGQPAWAAEEDSQIWLNLSGSTKVSEDVEVSLQIQPRFQLDEGRTDQLFLRTGLDYTLSKSVKIGGGLILLGEFGPTEKRPYQWINLGKGPLTFRTMAEQRFFDGADRPEIRLRQRVQYSAPIAQSTSLIVSGEAFYTAQSRNRGGDTRISQWRAIVQVNHKLNSDLTLSAGYLGLGVPVQNSQDRLSHIPTIGLSKRF